MAGKKSLEERIESTKSHLKENLNTVRAGRANPALLDKVMVNYYGSPTPLKALANVSVPDPRTLMISPFDPKSVSDIERAINEANIGINPANDGKVIRLAIPQLTEERRKELTKVVKNYGEEAKVAVRNLRRDENDSLKKMQKDFGITTIYVTHDQEEALTLSDRIAVFNKGYIEQIGTPNEVYNFSQTEFVCNFIGDINRLGPGVLEELAKAGAPVDKNKHNYIRLERLHVNQAPTADEVVLKGVVESREYYGLYIKYYITLDGQTIKVIEKNDGVNIYEPGQEVTVLLNPRDIMAYEAKEEA